MKPNRRSGRPTPCPCASSDGFPLTLPKGLQVLYAIAAAVAWGAACGVLRAPYWAVAAGGLAAATLGFWLSRAVLLGPDTARRKDFPLIAAAGFGFFAVLGVGLTSLACLLSGWWLHPLR